MVITMGVEQVLRSAHRPLTCEELLSRVKDKNRRSAFNELRWLRSTRQIVKIEIRVSVTQIEFSNPIILYRWIGDGKKKVGRGE